MNKNLKNKRHFKLRKRISGTQERPRVAVFRSAQHIYAQVIDDTAGQTIAFGSDLKLSETVKKERAYQVGKKLAEQCLKKKVKQVVFDRGGFLYHGRVAEIARGLREGGLEF